MNTYDFTIISSGIYHDADDFEDKFYKVGCDNATISFQNGRIVIDFSREAASLSEAVGSAIKAVNAAGAVVHNVAIE